MADVANHESASLGREGAFYLLGVICGAATGWADATLDDLLFTALLVLASCMLLGLLRPRRPWRWVLVVGACVPSSELLFYWLRVVQPTRAQIYGSFLAFLPGIAGAYGGSFLRQVLDHLRHGT
jgi:hypothetical protein